MSDSLITDTELLVRAGAWSDEVTRSVELLASQEAPLLARLRNAERLLMERNDIRSEDIEGNLRWYHRVFDHFAQVDK